MEFNQLPAEEFSAHPPVQPNRGLRKWLWLSVAAILLVGVGGYAAVALTNNRAAKPTGAPSPQPAVSASEQSKIGIGPQASTLLNVTDVVAQDANLATLLAAVLQVSANASIQGNLTVNGNGTFGGSLSAANFVGSGAGLTGVNAALLNGQPGSYYTGLASNVGALTTNAALRNAANTFVDANNFSAGLTSASITDNGALNIVGPTSLGGTTTVSSLILSAPLTVDNGGTGLAAVPDASVLYGQGGPSLGVATPGSAGLCLLSGASDVQWGSCSGASAGVATLDNLNGTLTLTNSTGVGTTITINDATAGAKGIASFNANNFSVVAGAVNTVQDIAVTATPTFAGLTLTAPLAVGSGGTGANSLTANGVIVGGGTGALSSVTAGAGGDCLVSTAGAPTFQVCPGAGGVTTVNNQSGALTVANATAAAGTITINDAVADGATKGIAAFNATNFSAASGVVNTIQNIAITSAPTFAGLTLTNQLTIPNGGTGATTLAANGVLLGNGASAITSLTTGTPNLCLESTAGAPVWAACTGGAVGGVTTLDNQAGVLTIANSSGSGGVVTIQDAGTAQKGIAQFNSTNFSVATGTVNTIQDIATSSSPTFIAVNTNSIIPSAAFTLGAASDQFSLQGTNASTIVASNGTNTTTLAFLNPTANVIYQFQAAAMGTYQICTTAGNCLGGSGGANAALSNLSGVAINTSLLPGSAADADLGSATLPFGKLFVAGTSGTPGTNNFQFTGVATAARTITIPDATGTICLTTGNCAGSGGGVTTAGGTTDQIAKFTGSGTIGDSSISDTGSSVTIQPSSNSTTTFQIQNAAATATLFSADTSNDRIDIGTTGTSTAQLYVGGQLPTSPVGTEGNSLYYYGQMAVQNGYVYSAEYGGDKMFVVNVTDPTNPTQIAHVDTGISSPLSTVTQGKYAYLVDSGTGAPNFAIMDISDPVAPVIEKDFTVPTDVNAGPLVVQGRYAYFEYQSASNDYISVIDVSNPANPSIVSTSQITTGLVGVYGLLVSGHYLYVDFHQASGTGLVIYDVNNPGNPSSIGTMPVGTTSAGLYQPMTMAIKDSYLYVANDNGNPSTGSVIDISNPASPSEVGRYNIGDNDSNQSLVQGNRLYTLNYANSTVSVDDISSPTSPSYIGYLNGTGNNMGLAIVGRYLYTAGYDVNPSLKIYDLGGTYTQQLEAGDTQTGSLTVTADATLGGNLAAAGDVTANGVYVEQNAAVAGDVAVDGDYLQKTSTDSTTAFQVQDASGNPALDVDSTNDLVGVGTNAPTGRLTVQGVDDSSNNDAVDITDSSGTMLEQIRDDGFVGLGEGTSATFGNAATGTPDTGENYSGLMVGSKFTTGSVAPTISSMSVYVNSPIQSSPNNQFQVGIYTDSGGSPNAWVASSTATSLTGNAWNTVPVSATLAANTPYWLVYTSNVSNLGNNTLDYINTSAPTYMYSNFTFGSGAHGGMPNTVTAGGISDHLISIYATTASVSTPALTVGTNGSIGIGTGSSTAPTANLQLVTPTNTSTAFEVQNAAGATLFNIDTAGSNINLGTSTLATTDIGSVAATIGYNSIGATQDQGGLNLIAGSQYTAPSTGVLGSMSTYIGPAVDSAPHNQYQMALYADNGSNVPGAYIASTAVGTITPSAWNTLPINASVTAGTKYWLVYWSNTSSGFDDSYNVDTVASQSHYYAYTHGVTFGSGPNNGMPATFPGGPDSDSNVHSFGSFYASYANDTTPALSVAPTGALTANWTATFQNATDSTSAFQVKNAAGSNTLLSIDTTNSATTLGTTNGAATTSIYGGSGGVLVQGGDGGVQVLTGDQAGTTAGINIQTGDSSTGDSGNITIDTGTNVPGGTQIEDDTFETGTDNYVGNGAYATTSSQTTAQAHGGTHSLEVTEGESGDWNVDTGEYNEASTPGHTYSFTAWVRADTVAELMLGQVYWTNGSVGEVSWGSVTDNTSGWSEITGTMTAPPLNPGASNEFLSVNFSGPNGNTGQIQYIDDVTVTDESSTTQPSVNIGTANAQAINIGSLSQFGITSVIGGGGVNVGAGNGGSINIGTSSATSNNVNIGNTGGGSTTLASAGVTQTLNNSGSDIVQSQTNSTDAFQVQDSSGASLLNVDTVDSQITAGTSSTTTFGNTLDSITAPDGGGGGGYYWDGVSKQELVAQHFTTAGGGAITSLSTYVGTNGISSTNKLYQMAVYADNAGQPGAYIASTAVGNLGSTAGWMTLPITATLSPNTNYWLVYWTNVNDNSNNGQDYINMLRGSSNGHYWGTYETWQCSGGCGASTNGMPNTYPTSGGDYDDSTVASIYATFANNLPALQIDSAGNSIQNGTALFQSQTDSDTALVVNNANNQPVLQVDTTFNGVGIDCAPDENFNLNVCAGGNGNGGGLSDEGYSYQLLDVQNDGNTYLGVDSINADVHSADLSVGDSVDNLNGPGLLVSDNFESGNFSLWSGGSSGGESVDSSESHSGRYSAETNVSSSTGYARTSFSSSSTTFTLNAWVWAHVLPTSGELPLFTLYQASSPNNKVQLYTDQNGCLGVINGTTDLGTDSCDTFIGNDGWDNIAMSINRTTGEIALYNGLGYMYYGARQADYTGLTIGSGWDTLDMGVTSSNTGQYWVDDLAFGTGITPSLANGLTVQDSLHVAGATTLGGQLLLQPASNSTNAFQVQNSAGGTILDTDTANNTLKVSGDIEGSSLAPPSIAPTVAVHAVAGNLNSTYYYTTTFVTASGETEYGPVSAAVSPSNQQVNITNIPTGPAGYVIARGLYRTKAGGSSAGPFYGVAYINDNTTTSYTDNFGDGSIGGGQDGYGYNSTSYFSNTEDQANSEAFGFAAHVSSAEDTALGNDSSVVGQSGVAVGYQAAAFQQATAIGTQASAYQNSVAIGGSATTNSYFSVALGGSATANEYAEAIGQNANAGYGDIALGYGATTTANNQLVVGANGFNISDVYLGSGVVDTSPQSVTIHATSSGTTGVAGANLTLDGGDATTGDADGGNAIVEGGAASGTGTSGSVVLNSQNNTGNTGSIILQSGDSSSGTSGNVSIDTGQSAVSSGSNVEDDTFESGLDGWTDGYGESTAQSAAQVHGGTHSMAITSTGGAWGNVAGPYPGGSVTPGQLYDFSAWVRGTAAEDITFYTNWTGGAGGTVTIGTVMDSTTGWTQISGSATAPAGATNVELLLEGNDAGSVTTYVDDIVASGGTSTPAVLVGSTNAAAVLIGNANEVGTTTLQGGSGGVNITAATGGTIAVGNTNNNIISIGNTAATEPLTLESEGIADTITGSATAPSDIIQTTTNSATAFEVQDTGSNNLLAVDTAGDTVSVGATGTTALAGTVNVGTSTGAAQTVNLGSNNGASATTIQGGTGNVNVLSTGNITIGQTPLSGSAFGYAGTGNNTGGCAGTCLSGSKFTTTAGGAIASMSVYFSSPNSGDQYAYAIYTDSSGAPGSYIASSGVGTFGSGGGGWYTLPITATLAPSTTYWLVFNDSGGTGVNFYTGAGASDANNTSYTFHSGPDNGFPATWPGGGAITGLNASIYATYTTGSVADVSIDPLGNLTTTGAATFENANDSTTAFQVQDAGSNDLFSVDTSGDNVNVGATGTTALAGTVNVGTSTGAAQTVNLGSGAGASATTLQGGTNGVAIQTGPDASGDSGSIIIQSGDATGTSGSILIDNGVGAYNSGSSARDDTFEDSPCSSLSPDYGPWGGGAGSIVGSNAQAHDGSCSLAVTESGTDGGYWGIQSTNFAITPGDQYTFTVWVRAASLAQAIQGVVQWGGAPGSVTLSTVTDTTSGWTEMTGSGVAPSGGYNYAYFQLYNSGDGNGSSTTYFDDVTATTNAGAPALDIGTSNAQTITVGNANQAGATTLQGGSGSSAVNILAASGGTINVANSVAANTLNLGAVSNDEASTVNINSYSGGSATKTTNLGSGDGASATTVTGGTGGVALSTGTGSGATGSINITTGNSSTATAGNINIDTGTSAPGSGTQLEDKTFEAGTGDGGLNDMGCWFSCSTVSTTTSQYHLGSQSLAMPEDSSGDSWGIIEAYPGDIAAVPGHTYAFSAWIRGTTAENINAGVTWPGAVVGEGDYDSAVDSTTAWTEYSGTLVAPAGTTNVYLNFGGDGSGASGQTDYFDDLTVTDLGVLTSPSITIGSANAQTLTVGNMNQGGYTYLYGGSDGIQIQTASDGTVGIGTENSSNIQIGAVGSSSQNSEVDIADTDNADQLINIGGNDSNAGSGDNTQVNLQGGQTAETIANAGVNIQTFTDSTTAFQVQNSANVAVLNVDTTDGEVAVTAVSDTTPALVVNNSDGTPAIEVRSGGSGGYNSFVGDDAGANNALNVGSTQGFQNSAFGNGALTDNSTGSYNTGLGMYTLHANHAGSYDTAVGNGSLQNLDNATAQYDTALGNNSANNGIDGNSNTAIGSYSLYYSDANDNTAVGAWALTPYDNGSGSANDTALGYYAAGIDSDGFETPGSIQGSTVIGYEAQVQANNSLILGGTGANAVKVGIGTTIPLNTFSVSPVYYSAGQAEVLSAGTTVTGLSTSWTTAMVGMQMIFGNGQTGIITAVGSGTSLTLNASQPITGNSNYRIQDIGFQVTSAGSAYVQNTSTTAFQIQTSSGTPLLTADTTNMTVTVQALVVSTNITVNGHIISGGSTPGIAAGAAACSSPTVSISGTDTAGLITVTTGSSCGAGGKLATITFSSAFGAAPRVDLTPGETNAAGLHTYVDSATISATAFDLDTQTSDTISNATTYKWYYHVIQ